MFAVAWRFLTVTVLCPQAEPRYAMPRLENSLSIDTMVPLINATFSQHLPDEMMTSRRQHRNQMDILVSKLRSNLTKEEILDFITSSNEASEEVFSVPKVKSDIGGDSNGKSKPRLDHQKKSSMVKRNGDRRLEFHNTINDEENAKSYINRLFDSDLNDNDERNSLTHNNRNMYILQDDENFTNNRLTTLKHIQDDSENYYELERLKNKIREQKLLLDSTEPEILLIRKDREPDSKGNNIMLADIWYNESSQNISLKKYISFNFYKELINKFSENEYSAKEINLPNLSNATFRKFGNEEAYNQPQKIQDNTAKTNNNQVINKYFRNVLPAEEMNSPNFSNVTFRSEEAYSQTQKIQEVTHNKAKNRKPLKAKKSYQDKLVVIPIIVHFDRALKTKLIKLYADRFLKTFKKWVVKLIRLTETKLRRINDNIMLVIEEIQYMKHSKRMYQTGEGSANLRTYYCNWQTMRKIIHNEWFYSILITGEDLFYVDEDRMEVFNIQDERECTIEPGNSYVGGFCSLDESCTILQRNDDLVDVTLTHKLGHSLGLKHDGSSFLHVMSPIRDSRLGIPYKWSAANIKGFKAFYRSKLGECLHPRGLIQQEIKQRLNRNKA